MRCRTGCGLVAEPELVLPVFSLAQPDVKEQLLSQGAYSVITTPEEAAARIHREVEMWAKVIKEANVKPD